MILRILLAFQLVAPTGFTVSVCQEKPCWWGIYSEHPCAHTDYGEWFSSANACPDYMDWLKAGAMPAGQFYEVKHPVNGITSVTLDGFLLDPDIDYVFVPPNLIRAITFSVDPKRIEVNYW